MSSWRLSKCFDHGVVEGVGRGLEVQADEANGLAQGLVGLGVSRLPLSPTLFDEEPLPEEKT